MTREGGSPDRRIVATGPRSIKRCPGRTTVRWGVRWVTAAAAATAIASAPLEAQAPDEAWRTLSTEHFRVTFPERLEPIGRRAAAHAERAWDGLSEAFPPAPRGVIDLVVTDHTDVSNGFARVTPSNRITVFARPPVDDLALGYFDAWLELVVTHELAHVFHLDRTGFIGRVGRALFGRVPTSWPIFPGTATPRWTTEGLATWYESALTGAGRVRGTYHEMVVRTAAWEDRFEQFDQVSGQSPVWPAGDRAYTYGSQFFEYLLERHGDEKMTAFADAVAGQWIPYRMDAAGRSAFGAALSEEWGRWAALRRAQADSTAEALQRLGPLTRPERLTEGARTGLHPQVSPDGARLAYVRADGRSDPQIRLVGPDGSGRLGHVRTNGLGTFDWLPDGGLVFAQLELDDPYRSYRDLYRAGAAGGVRRLTRGARLDHPSASPDGTWAVAVQEGDGTNALVRVDLATGEVSPLVAPDPDAHWSFPAVSPDGRWIAVSRWTTGAYLDLVLLDASGATVATVTRDRAMDVAPAWSPDGRHLLWSSDRTGIPNVVGAEVHAATGSFGPVRLVTNVVTGAGYPSVDPTGSWLYFSGYHADGWEVERIPFEPASWMASPAPDARFAPVPPAPLQPAFGEVGGYSAIRTLLPRYWEPLYQEPIRTRTVRTQDLLVPGREVLGAGIGLETAGFDVVGRHAYEAFARVFTSGGKVDGGFAYTFAGFGNPHFSIGASQLWDEDGPRLAQASDTAAIDTLFVRLRERNVSLATTLRRSRWRDALALTLSGGLTWEHRELLETDLEPSTRYGLTRPDARFSDVRATLAFTTARGHAFQTGAAEGLSVVVRGRRKNELDLADTLVSVPGFDRSLEEVLASARGYLPLGGPGHAAHVLAVRGAYGGGRGPGADAGHFEVGGASGSPEDVTGLTLFGGTPLFFPVRGYGRASRFGRFAWSATGEYRFPLLLVHQGLGAWPLHLDRVVGALFADAGNAWGPELGVPGYQNPRRPAIASVGAEVTAGFLALWTDPLLVRTGVAFPLRDGDGARVYVRVGLSF